MLGLGRDAAVRFAFLLGVPAIAGAACYEGLKALKSGVGTGVGAVPTTAGFVAAFVSSWIALTLLIRVVRRVGLWVFSPYCLALGLAAVVYFSRR
jgi:undecaprenyl-diphosphatase